MSIRTTRRAMGVAAAAALLVVPVAGTAMAQTAVETGDYRASADSSVLEAIAGDVTEGFTLLDAAIAPSSTAADTTGGLEFDGESGLSSFGTGTNAGLTLADELEAQGLLVEATQTAPPDNEAPTFEELLEVDADPLLITQLATAEALARDCAEVACPEDGLVSFGTSEVNDTRLFPEGAEGEDVAHLADTVDSRSEVSLTDLEGQDTKGVQAQATASMSRVDLFGGQNADGLTIEVASEPTLTAVAGGTPGSAEVTYDAPLVLVNGEGIEADPGQEQRLSIPPDAAPGEEDLLLDLEFGRFSSQTSDDGTSASGEATLLIITALNAPDLGTLGEIRLAPLSVDATAPGGGVDCPTEPAAEPDDGLDVEVDGPDEVAPGEEFEHTIEVTNDLACPLEDLVVVSEITGPDGAEVTDTDPDGDVDGLTVTWSDLEALDIGETTTFTVTVSVPEDAEAGVSFRNDVTATGVCDGEDVAGEGDVVGPVVADDGAVLPADGEPDVDTRPAASERLPETGGGIALLGLAALGLATALHRRG